MTPVFSHYTTNHISWISGVGKDKKGPCDKGLLARSTCSTVHFSDFEFTPGPA